MKWRSMKVVCVVPPLHFPVNELGHGYQPPLGLLSIAGPLADAGFSVKLVDADAAHLSNQDVVAYLRTVGAQVVLLGHSGSMAANPSALELLGEIKNALPTVKTVYGGVYPTYAAREIMSVDKTVDFIVLGEGEETTLALLRALQNNSDCFDSIKGLAWRSDGKVVINRQCPVIQNLDQYRVAWELANWSLYPGRHLPGRSAIVQFSRGCPNTCTYCGQWMFWKRWRHRSVSKFVDELQYLREVHDVRTVWVADENWGYDRNLFHELLGAISERKLGISIFCALCAEDIVRDADRLDLYRSAGIVCLMMGVESFDEAVLGRVGKNNPYSITTKAVNALRQRGILSVVNVIYGLRDETWRSLLQTLVLLRRMSPDFFNALHLTPLSWTKEGREIDQARIIQPDQRLWNFRQPVIQPVNFSPRGIAIAVKLSEALFYFRPAWFLSRFFDSDLVRRQIMRDSFLRLARVYLSEWRELFRAKFLKPGLLSRTGSQHGLLMPQKRSIQVAAATPKWARSTSSEIDEGIIQDQ